MTPVLVVLASVSPDASNHPLRKDEGGGVPISSSLTHPTTREWCTFGESRRLHLEHRGVAPRPVKPSEYGSVVLPFTVLRRLDAVLADTKPQVLEVASTIDGLPEMLQSMKLRNASGHEVYNSSPFTMASRLRRQGSTPIS